MQSTIRKIVVFGLVCLALLAMIAPAMGNDDLMETAKATIQQGGEKIQEAFKSLTEKEPESIVDRAKRGLEDAKGVISGGADRILATVQDKNNQDMVKDSLSQFFTWFNATLTMIVAGIASGIAYFWDQITEKVKQAMDQRNRHPTPSTGAGAQQPSTSEQTRYPLRARTSRGNEATGTGAHTTQH